MRAESSNLSCTIVLARFGTVLQVTLIAQAASWMRCDRDAGLSLTAARPNPYRHVTHGTIFCHMRALRRVAIFQNSSISPVDVARSVSVDCWM
jgi:hypothetical protein